MYKLEFGPKAFVVVSDPVVVRHILKVQMGLHKQASYMGFIYRNGGLRLKSQPAQEQGQAFFRPGGAQHHTRGRGQYVQGRQAVEAPLKDGHRGRWGVCVAMLHAHFIVLSSN